MHMMWFTERAYHYDPEVEPEKYRLLENQVLKLRSFFGTPNRFFDPEHGSKLLNQYLDEKVYTDQELLNFDGVMLNEHHGTPFCLGAVMDVEAAALAAKTKRVKIVLLGNPAATVANQLRLAEELAMIDLISGGRLVSGWVRGAGSEQFANNTNPALNRELFEESVDFIIKAWTTPGPFRHEGKRLHFRHVNPWVLPLQKPHPPFWIPGLISPDTAMWCAKRRYPYVALATKLEPTIELWDYYGLAAAREGYQAGPENFGYLQPVMIGDNQARAEELGKRRVRPLCASRMDVPARLQLQVRHSAARPARHRSQRVGQTALHDRSGHRRSDREPEEPDLWRVSTGPERHADDRGNPGQRDPQALHDPRRSSSRHLLVLARWAGLGQGAQTMPGADQQRCDPGSARAWQEARSRLSVRARARIASVAP
jgi:alkanesulfonate monooxygenase SsuD/methylene tetrahydromethanopterin reductase-like flavin-dependent oxidoreductase (luciferase family)